MGTGRAETVCRGVFCHARGYAYLAQAQGKRHWPHACSLAPHLREETGTRACRLNSTTTTATGRAYARRCPTAELDALLQEGRGMAMENALALAQREAEDESVPA